MSKHWFALGIFVGLLSLSSGNVGWAGGGEGKLKFEIYQDAVKDFRWRLKAANGEVLATAGQGYKAKADAEKGVERIQQEVVKLKFEMYEDKAKEHRWRLKAANGQTVATSAEGYKALADAEKAITLIKKGAPKAEVSYVK